MRAVPKLLAAQRGRRTKAGAARARKAARRLKMIAGRVVRQLDAAVPEVCRGLRWVETAKKILSQKRSDSGKIYSLHEPEVYCMSKIALQSTKIRKAFLLKIKPGAAEEYTRRHNPIWPELETTLREHGV